MKTSWNETFSLLTRRLTPACARMNSDEPSDVLVIGLGNDYRGDDGAGHRCVRLLERGDGVRVLEESGEGAALMDSWQGADTVILIDAVQSGRIPGTIHRLDAHSEAIPAQFFHYSTHAFSVAEAVELARALDRLPQRLILYGIEGANFAAGESLSPEVSRAVGEVAERVRREIQQLTTNK